jgi:SAM-dependent methyltransferase
MKESLLSRLVCPSSGGPLTLVGEERIKDEIVGGLLTAADYCYPIVNGVPCFLTFDQQIAAKDGFTPMWRYRQEGKFEQRNLYGVRPERKADWVAQQFRSTILAGEWVLDAGCGSAETTYALARKYPETQFVGLDFSDAVRTAAEGSGELSNLHFVQADITHPPFSPRQFGHVFALGVLHHTPDTRAAFEGAAGLVQPRGELLAWLYPAPHESFMAAQLYFIRDLHFLGKGHTIPPDWRFKAARLYSLGLMPAMATAYSLYRVLSKFGGKKEVKVLSEDMTLRELYETTAFAVYDNITPRYQHRHRKETVLGWFRELGFGEAGTDGHGTFVGRSESPVNPAP